MKLDYNRQMEDKIASLDGAKPTLLLHSCCAPCTSTVLERLYPYFDITLYYYNPNTQPYEEFLKRGEELPKLIDRAELDGVRLIIGEYEDDRYMRMVQGLESAPEGGERCGVCFNLRLGKTKELADSKSFDYFCSTLTVSPHKNAPLINAIGAGLSSQGGAEWLPSDFKKKNGYLRSIELSKKYELYRQCYCGCLFSLNPSR